MSGEPERTAVYRIRDEEGALLYVGVTNHVGVRWNQHMLAQPWWSDVRALTVEWHDSREEALAAEKAAILAEQPKHNVTHLKVSRGRWQGRRPQCAQQPPALPEITLEPREDDDDLITAGQVAKMTHQGTAGRALQALRVTGGPAGFKLGSEKLFRMGQIRQWIAAVEASQNPRAAAVTRVVPEKKAPGKTARKPTPRAVTDEGAALFERDNVVQLAVGGAA